MLDRQQEQSLQDLARSIASSLDELGADCTARLLASVALGLLDSPESEESAASVALRSARSAEGVKSIA